MATNKTYKAMNDWLKDRPIIQFLLSVLSGALVALLVFSLTSWREDNQALQKKFDNKLDVTIYESDKKECMELIDSKVSKDLFGEYMRRIDDHHKHVDDIFKWQKEQIEWIRDNK